MGSDGITSRQDSAALKQQGNSLGSRSAWLSPAAPPSTSSPSRLSSGPLTHRHYNTQREGVSDDTATTRLGMKKVNRHAWKPNTGSSRR